ncbi:proline--tRNA ligase [Corallococcus sp. AB049A]|uniref:Proline--tRNA ligase n=1 Tax=Corallococcus interemptor TaxID=2316720 RepID=A0A3A8QM44_9BACT|nr:MULTISPECIES: proline--tRNA ligase [Corallococcus]RKH44440.1 proline--tRNA ligase [Corallococcus sp. AB050B]RKH64254.1 proline--tRNA ligase [Corallococcus interemptor]RKI52840.1 proline--tRNA ligase [Corallococcus sp. AB049A]
MAEKLTPREKGFSEWYVDLVQKAKLADYSDVKGCMVIRPNGYALWENIQRTMDRMFKDTGVKNAYFPLLIPESYLKKEAEHVEGFNPQLAIVTHAGGSKLEEPYVIRPTSETIINRSFSKWIQSYRDLPLLVNQWANVMRWEMRTRLFLRTTEFLWQEGHTCHETEADAEERTLQMLEVYRAFAEDYLAMPVLPGRKSESEKFAGALRTYSIEAMMQDKKALQAGTSHNLGQNFAKAFDTTFQGRDGQQHHVWQTSWGSSTRLIGGLILTHSDDTGLVVPPKIAATHVVIIPIAGKATDAEKTAVLERSHALAADLRKAGLGVVVDDDDTKSPGFKYNEHELIGTCLRIELGPKDLAKNSCVMVRRDLRQKEFVSLEEAATKAQAMLDQMQKDLFQKARDFRDSHTFEVNSYEELKAKAEDGFLLAHWDLDPKTEARIKEETGLTTRCRPFSVKQEPGKCVMTGNPSPGRIVFSKAY